MSKSITLNSIYNFILKVFRLIVPVLVGPYIQRLFNAQLYGSFNDASTWVDLALVFGSFGIYTYAVREVSAVRDDREKARISSKPPKSSLIVMYSTFTNAFL